MTGVQTCALPILPNNNSVSVSIVLHVEEFPPPIVSSALFPVVAPNGSLGNSFFYIKVRMMTFIFIVFVLFISFSQKFVANADVTSIALYNEIRQSIHDKVLAFHDMECDKYGDR